MHGNWKTTTFIAALRHNRVTAPFVLEGAMDGETFRAYVEQVLAPTLKKGEIVFMDNVPKGMTVGKDYVKKPSKRVAPFFSTFPLTARTSIQSNKCSPSSKPSSARSPLTLSKVPPIRSSIFARPSPLASMKSLVLRVRLKTLLRIAKFSQHEADGRKF